MKIKRYILLAGCTYYPMRWQDFKGAGDKLSEMVAQGEALLVSDVFVDWYQVIDLATHEIAAEGEVEDDEE